MNYSIPVKSRTTRYSLVSIFAMALIACGSIPDSIKVREGISPANADKNVRFRTTYYFRVYDYCYNASSRAQFQPVTDSLYRFVMTGKANAYANRVRFESGTLKAAQIDPFGATIERDDNTGRLRFVPEAEVQAKARLSNAINDIDALVELKKNLVKLNADSENKDTGTQSIVDKSTLNEIDKKINELVGARLSEGQISSAAATVSIDPQAALLCPAGSQIQRGFQVMGPQGVKTFNQDERLLMAMSSDAKPLIASLSEVSGRYLSAQEQQQAVSDILLPLVREQLLVSEINSAKFEFAKPEQVQELYQKVRLVLAPKEKEVGE